MKERTRIIRRWAVRPVNLGGGRIVVGAITEQPSNTADFDTIRRRVAVLRKERS